jgi:hypothetical protein
MNLDSTRMTIEKSGDRSVHSGTVEGKSKAKIQIQEFHVVGIDGVERCRIEGNATLKPPIFSRDTDYVQFRE